MSSGVISSAVTGLSPPSRRKIVICFPNTAIPTAPTRSLESCVPSPLIIHRRRGTRLERRVIRRGGGMPKVRALEAGGVGRGAGDGGRAEASGGSAVGGGRRRCRRWGGAAGGGGRRGGRRWG